MIRLTKQADYAILLLIHMAEQPEGAFHSARGLAEEVHLPLPMVSKVLKQMARQGLLHSHRGVRGGYCLAVDPQRISVAEIIETVEGPIGITDCSTEDGALCSILAVCTSRRKWNRINEAIQQTLRGISLAEMASPLTPASALAEGDILAAVTATAK